MHSTACQRSPFPSTGRRGVGLVEMMLSVVLICLIATVAIPQLLTLHRKAMRAEVMPNLRAIGMAEQAWFASEASWVEAGPNPVPPVDRALRDFDRKRPDWRPLAWYPEGQVRCSYSTTILDRGVTVRADALCDLDADKRMLLLRFEVPRANAPGVFLDLYPERF
ncbi:MAG: hypothetical protein GXP62_05755 [Oligoflexia bacterium]|nr:hypothetical protein [Oligoflexia bacterium]